MDTKDPNVIAETELLQAAASIEAAAKKLSELRPRRTAVRHTHRDRERDRERDCVYSQTGFERRGSKDGMGTFPSSLVFYQFSILKEAKGFTRGKMCSWKLLMFPKIMFIISGIIRQVFGGGVYSI